MNNLVKEPAKAERELYEKQADRIVLDIKHFGLHDRKWSVDSFKVEYQNCPKALAYFEGQLQAYISKELGFVDEMQQLHIKQAKSGDNFYLGQIFKTLIMIGENKRLQELIDSGVDVSTAIGSSRPLHVAAQAGNIPAMEALISAGADVHEKDMEKNTPLHCCTSNTGATSLLLKRGADPSIPDFDGNVPWCFADDDMLEAYAENGYSLVKQ
jgi:hypothetical protein